MNGTKGKIGVAILAGLLFAGAASAAPTSSGSPATTLALKCTKAPAAAFLKSVGKAIAMTAENSLADSGVTDIKIRVSFKSTLRGDAVADKELSRILNGLTVQVGAGEALGVVDVDGTKANFTDDCTYDVKATVALRGKTAEGTKVAKRTVSDIVVTAPRITIAGH